MRFPRETDESLARDPQEADPRFAAAFVAASEQAARDLEGHPLHGGLGFCRVYWLRKKQILWEHFGIEWRSPADLNPFVLFE